MSNNNFNEKNYNLRKTIKMLKQYLFNYKLLVLLSITLAFLSVVSSLLVPVYIGKCIDTITNASFNINSFKTNALIITLLILITFVLKWTLGIVNNYITSNITRDIRKDAFNKITTLPLKYIDTNPSGKIVSRVISDVDTFSDGLLIGFTELFTGVLTIIGTFVMMIVINWIISLIVAILTPLSIFVAKFIASKTHRFFESQTEDKAIQTAFIDEMINNLKVVQAFSHEDENEEEFKKMNDKLTESSLNAVFFSSLVNPSTRFVNNIIYSFVCFAGAYIIIESPLGLMLTIGSLSTLLSYSKEFMKPFNEISGVITELQNAFVCADKIFDIINEQSEIINKDAIELTNVKGNIDFHNVYFSYTREKRLIEDLNLKIRKGMKVAIVGPTGSGKTTIINLLMRFYAPTSGDILIDNINIRDITKKSLRDNFGMVLQDTWLQKGTILDNIRMGKPEATLEEVIKASKETHAHYFIEKLKDGYNTVIDENGNGLSAGEMQLLCITRVMLLMPPMLILDEATSSIDTRTELKIQDAFNKLMKGKTSFIVAHRLSTIKEADIILVLKDGKVIEQGNHNSLIKQKGFYYELFNSQFINKQ